MRGRASGREGVLPDKSAMSRKTDDGAAPAELHCAPCLTRNAWL